VTKRDPEEYANGMLEALIESPDRFSLEWVQFDGDAEALALFVGEKPVALILTGSFDVIDDLIEAAFEAAEGEDDGEPDDEPRARVVEGRVVKRGPAKKAGWKP
jgi:hypothetical protein